MTGRGSSLIIKAYLVIFFIYLYVPLVVMGAATGVIIGRSVTWHGRNFYGQLQPEPGGFAIAIATR